MKRSELSKSNVIRLRYLHFGWLRYHNRAPFGFLLLLAGLIGCSGRVSPVNVSKAMDALELSLESWKEGKRPDDLNAGSSPIVVHELEWSRGTNLLDYEIVSEEQNADQSLIAWVKLKSRSGNGQVTETTAQYIVNTSPVVTVLRMMIRK